MRTTRAAQKTIRTVRHRALGVFAAALACAAGLPTMAAATQICTGGLYRATPLPLIEGTPASEDGLIFISGSQVSIGSACQGGKVKLRGTASGTKLTARWSSCVGLTGKVKLVATISPSCDFIPKAKLKAKLFRKEFSANLEPLPPPAVIGQPIRDWGYPGLRAEVDVNGDGLGDYCRFVGDAPGIFLSCQLRLANGLYGPDYEFNSKPGIDRGWSDMPTSLTDVNGDGRADYCRYVGSRANPFRACAFATSTGFGIDDHGIGRPIRDWGFPNLLRAYVDVNGDGLPDYCRFVGDAPNIFLSCQLRRSDGSYGYDYAFNSAPGIDPGYPDPPATLRAETADGRVYFCRMVGNPGAVFRACMAAGPEGFSLDQFQLDPTDECALGTDNCDPNATCSNTASSFQCTCNPGFVGDGTSCRERCTTITVGAGVERCVEAGEAGVNLYLSRYDTEPWTGTYVQADEPDVNYCGPTAAKNFLSWYGLDDTYQNLASQMNTNEWDTLPIIGAAMVVCLGNPLCAGPLAALVADHAAKIGTLPVDMRRVLYDRMPAGYRACGTQGVFSLDAIYQSLAGGDPVIYLESEEGNQLHWAVITGMYDQDGHTWFHFANSDDRSWEDLWRDWSLHAVGSSAVRGILADDILQVRPFTSIRWCR